jgi:hypothetical protein
LCPCWSCRSLSGDSMAESLATAPNMIGRLDHTAVSGRLRVQPLEYAIISLVNSEDRFMRVCGRASYEAWEYLKKLRSHPTFPDLLRHLDELRGTLLRTHVEETFEWVRSRNEQRGLNRRSVAARRFRCGRQPPHERRVVGERRAGQDRRSH